MRLTKKNLTLVLFIAALLISQFFPDTLKQPKSDVAGTQITATPIPSPIPITPFLSPSPNFENPQDSIVVVKRIIDGDTIELEDGRKLRYIGIDTPETVDPRRGTQCYGKLASERNKELVLGKKVRLEKDVNETDKFGRLLRYVYLVADRTGLENEPMVNEILVQEGFAISSAYPPDIRYQEKLDAAENDARTNNRGLWGNCIIENDKVRN